MKAELTSKETRTVYDKKVVRLTLDVPYERIEDAEQGNQDILKWLDANVDSDVGFTIGPFEDEDQAELDEVPQADGDLWDGSEMPDPDSVDRAE